ADAAEKDWRIDHAGGPNRRRARTLAARASARPSGPARAANDAARLGAGMLAVLQHLDAIDEHVIDTGRQLLRLLERCVVLDGRRVEHDHIAVISRRQPAAVPD